MTFPTVVVMLELFGRGTTPLADFTVLKTRAPILAVRSFFARSQDFPCTKMMLGKKTTYDSTAAGQFDGKAEEVDGKWKCSMP